MNVSLSIEKTLDQLIKRKADWENSLNSGKVHTLIDSATTLLTTLYCVGGVALFTTGRLQWVNTYSILFGVSLVLLTMYFREQRKAINEAREKAYKNYEDLRKYLMNKVNTSFCPCKEGCNCKESFLSYVEREKGINLYY